MHAIKHGARGRLGVSAAGWVVLMLALADRTAVHRSIYRETIGGLHRSAIRVQRAFSLVRATGVEVFKDGLALNRSGPLSAAR
jgi:hypothetical protein